MLKQKEDYFVDLQNRTTFCSTLAQAPNVVRVVDLPNNRIMIIFINENYVLQGKLYLKNSDFSLSYISTTNIATVDSAGSLLLSQLSTCSITDSIFVLSYFSTGTNTMTRAIQVLEDNTVRLGNTYAITTVSGYFYNDIVHIGNGIIVKAYSNIISKLYLSSIQIDLDSLNFSVISSSFDTGVSTLAVYSAAYSISMGMLNSQTLYIIYTDNGTSPANVAYMVCISVTSTGKFLYVLCNISLGVSSTSNLKSFVIDLNTILFTYNKSNETYTLYGKIIQLDVTSNTIITLNKDTGKLGLGGVQKTVPAYISGGYIAFLESGNAITIYKISDGGINFAGLVNSSLLLRDGAIAQYTYAFVSKDESTLYVIFYLPNTPTFISPKIMCFPINKGIPLGIAQDNNEVILNGIVPGLSKLLPGKQYYADSFGIPTTNNINTTSLGKAISDTEILMD